MGDDIKMRFSIINEPLLEIFKDFGNEFALQLLDKYMTHTKGLTQRLEFAFDQQEFQEIRAIARELKSSSNDLGFFKFSKRCATIERAIAKGSIHELPFLVVNVIEEAKLLEMSLCEIKSVVSGRSNSSAS